MIHRCLGEPQGWYKGTHRGQLAVKETYITRKLQLLTYLSYFPLQSQSPMVNERPYQVFHARVRSRLRVCITVIYVPRIASKDRHRSLLDLILYLQPLDPQCTKYIEEPSIASHVDDRNSNYWILPLVPYNTARCVRLHRSIIGGAQIGHANHLYHWYRPRVPWSNHDAILYHNAEAWPTRRSCPSVLAAPCTIVQTIAQLAKHHAIIDRFLTRNSILVYIFCSNLPE